IKIANGALTKFYHSTGSSGGSQSLTVPVASPNPTILFIWAEAATTNVQVRRTRGNKLIGTCQVHVDWSVRDSLFDDDPIDGDQYTVNNIEPAVYRELSAMVILA